MKQGTSLSQTLEQPYTSAGIAARNVDRALLAPAGANDDRVLLSKTDFLNFRICPGYCWVAKHQPDRVPVETDPDVHRRLDDGNTVETLARQRFPGATMIATLDPLEAVRETEAAIAAGATTLFGAAVLTGQGLLARADVLIRDGDGWLLYEIKASTSVTGEHRADATFQAVAFMDAGYRLHRVAVLHLDRDYRRAGAPDPRAMFVLTDLTDHIDRSLVGIMEQIDRALAVVQGTIGDAPCRCDRWTRGRRCPTFSLFHPHIPNGGTVYDLTSIQHMHLRAVLDRGILSLEDWPDDVPLSRRQRLQVETHRSREPWVDRARLRTFLDGLRFPLAFLDYESCQTPVPLYDGCAPWAQIPFQYSLHTVTADGAIEHREFLWTDPVEFPVPHLVRRLREDIVGDGSVVVWSRGSESGRNLEMADALPEHAGFLLGLNERMVDLMETVTGGVWMDPGFNGSASIKKVLPTVAPELSYDTLAIGNGGLAAERWHAAMVGAGDASDTAEREHIFSALREYCHLDTLAMVRIWEHLRSLLR